jgi:acyl carrier protein
MDEKEIFEKVADTMAVVLNVDRAEITPDSSMDSIDAWDSLKHMKLVMALEQEFDFEFEEEQIVEMLSVRLIVLAVAEKLAA